MKNKIKVGMKIRYDGQRGEVLSLPDDFGELQIRLENGKVLFVYVEELTF